MRSWREVSETLRVVGSVELVGISEGEVASLAQTLGSVVGDWQRLVATPKETARKNTLSSRYGLGYFPWHTDGAAIPKPPRYVLLRAKGGSSTPTELIHVDRHIALLELLRGTTLRAVDQRNRVRYLRACISEGATTRYRWDPRTCLPTRAAEATLAAVEECAPDAQVNWTNERVLIIDNWRVFHRRPPVADHQTRQLERLYVHDRGAH